jgi:hypothetical protein
MIFVALFTNTDLASSRQILLSPLAEIPQRHDKPWPCMTGSLPPSPLIVISFVAVTAFYTVLAFQNSVRAKSLVFRSSVRDAHLWAPKSISTHLGALTFGSWRAASTHLLVHSTPAVVEWGQLGIYKAFTYKVQFFYFCFYRSNAIFYKDLLSLRNFFFFSLNIAFIWLSLSKRLKKASIHLFGLI